MNAFVFSRRSFMALAGNVFLLAGILHTTRAFYEWPLVINLWFVPVWLSWVAGMLAFVLAYNAFTTLKHLK